MHLYRTSHGLVAGAGDGQYRRLSGLTLDALFSDADVRARLADYVSVAEPTDAPARVLAPIQSQEVWASGVTYLRSKAARMEEAREAGGGSFYDRVYDADRPELFFKATPHRVSGPDDPVRVRADSSWTVPEPELALAVSADGVIFGYTVGNDMSARDIEGENPLYLPQAKTYRQCCGLGPGLLVRSEPLPVETAIRLRIEREGAVVFEDATALDQMKRSPEELVGFLLRDQQFPAGCYLLTGTGIVPPDSFALQAGDRIRIDIDDVGTLEQSVVR